MFMTDHLRKGFRPERYDSLYESATKCLKWIFNICMPSDRKKAVQMKRRWKTVNVNAEIPKKIQQRVHLIQAEKSQRKNNEITSVAT